MSDHLVSRIKPRKYLVLDGWAGRTRTLVEVVTVGETRALIEAVTRTKLAGRDRWLEPGERAYVPLKALSSRGRS